MLVINLFDDIQNGIQKIVDFRTVFIYWTRVDDEADPFKSFDSLHGFWISASEQPCKSSKEILVAAQLI